jgi:hypothetical protein
MQAMADDRQSGMKKYGGYDGGYGGGGYDYHKKNFEVEKEKCKCFCKCKEIEDSYSGGYDWGDSYSGGYDKQGKGSYGGSSYDKQGSGSYGGYDHCEEDNFEKKICKCFCKCKEIEDSYSRYGKKY